MGLEFWFMRIEKQVNYLPVHICLKKQAICRIGCAFVIRYSDGVDQ